MVATHGKGWVISPSALRAVKEADAIAPGRSHASDGSIGDAAHAARDSFHNPQDGYVDAVDITHDPAGGFDAHAHADYVVASRPDHLDHVISNRRVASAAKGWVWRPYTGTNPHDHHIHVANKRTSAGRNFIGSIFGPPQEDFMSALTDEEQRRMLGNTDVMASAVSGILGTLTFLVKQSGADHVDEASLAAALAPLLAGQLEGVDKADIEQALRNVLLDGVQPG